MVKINFSQAREFLEGINAKDNVAIVTHNDMDGFCSGILFRNFCIQKKCKYDVYFLNHGVNKLSDFNLEKYNKVLIADLAPNLVSDGWKNLKSKKVFYTDHHQEDPAFPVAEEVLELRTINEGYIPSSRTCFELTQKENKDLKFFSVLGVISDYGFVHEVNKEFLENFYSAIGGNFEAYKEWTHKFNAVITYFAPDFEKAFEKFTEIKKVEDIEIFSKYYSEVETEFARLEEDFRSKKENLGEIIYFNFNSKFSAIKSALITSLSSNEKSKVFVSTTDKGEKISVSGRNQSREYDVSKILQNCIEGFQNSTAGGHKVAAGAVIMKEDLEKFKERLKQIKLEKYRI